MLYKIKKMFFRFSTLDLNAKVRAIEIQIFILEYLYFWRQYSVKQGFYKNLQNSNSTKENFFH